MGTVDLVYFVSRIDLIGIIDRSTFHDIECIAVGGEIADIGLQIIPKHSIMVLPLGLHVGEVECLSVLFRRTEAVTGGT